MVQAVHQLLLTVFIIILDNQFASQFLADVPGIKQVARFPTFLFFNDAQLVFQDRFQRVDPANYFQVIERAFDQNDLVFKIPCVLVDLNSDPDGNRPVFDIDDDSCIQVEIFLVNIFDKASRDRFFNFSDALLEIWKSNFIQERKIQIFGEPDRAISQSQRCPAFKNQPVFERGIE